MLANIQSDTWFEQFQAVTTQGISRVTDREKLVWIDSFVVS